MNDKFYKYCAVPMCKNTSISTPKKLFIHVPKNKQIRKKWLTMAKRDPASLSVTTTSYFCEDHFDLPNDMENYVQYTIMGIAQIKMRTGCIPTKFACQANSASTTSDSDQPVAARRKGATFIKECKLDQTQTSASQQCDDPSGTSSDLIASGEEQESIKIDKTVETSHVKSSKRRRTTTKTFTKSHIRQVWMSTSPLKVSKLQPPLPMRMDVTGYNSVGNDNTSDRDSAPSVAESVPSKASSDAGITEQGIKIDEKVMLKATINKISKNPQFYIGVPKNCYYLVNIIQEQTGIPEYQILLCLKKIRLDSKFSELGDDFGMTGSYACKIFKENIPKIAKVMRPFVVNLNKAANKRCLPIAFRKNYQNITCIVDCLEIEIKPSKALKQTNIVKYLISSTPSGLINYISNAYSGRITDVCLVANCDFLNCLPSGSYVMADSRFDHIEPLLHSVGCRLVQPPSDESGETSPEEKVKETKQIAALRIHIQQQMRRLREYSMLKPHACINNLLLCTLDDILVIACGLVNLQNFMNK